MSESLTGEEAYIAELKALEKASKHLRRCLAVEAEGVGRLDQSKITAAKQALHEAIDRVG